MRVMYIDVVLRVDKRDIVLMSVGTPSKKKTTGQPVVKKYSCKEPGCSFVSAYMKDLDRHHRIHTGN